MSEGNQTWPEQNAVDEWCEKHAAKGPLGSWYIYADFSILMELKEAVTAYRLTVEKERDALKARVGYLESRLELDLVNEATGEMERVSEACDGISCRDETIHSLDGHNKWLLQRLLKAEARVAELEAEVERLREVKLPEITDEIWNRWVFPSLRLLGFNENDECEWTRDAVEFVALLNEARALAKAKGE